MKNRHDAGHDIDTIARDVLDQLLRMRPQPTHAAPRDRRGVYGLVDHLGTLRYIGSTSVASENLYRRIHHRHRTGSETASHYFSRMYNTGRMWRRRNDPSTQVDGDIAKALRNAFIAKHCRAVWVPLPDSLPIQNIEDRVLALAPPEAIAWNRRGMEPYEEPEELVDAVIDELGFSFAERAALDRQRQRYLSQEPQASGTLIPMKRLTIPGFPAGPFRFVALDVETANSDRASICQVGVACVRPDNTIETWCTLVNPQTDRWAFCDLHGITPPMVLNAPTFQEVLPTLDRALRGLVVYQHSGFDRSAIRKACERLGIGEPSWEWRDSVVLARRAWPELRGNRGHGLASLKTYLGIDFRHHDAGEDARAAAEVVLRAERTGLANNSVQRPIPAHKGSEAGGSKFAGVAPLSHCTEAPDASRQLLGEVRLTQGNLNNNHFYLKDIWDLFPRDCIGGSNRASAAPRTITVDWGGNYTVETDLDGTKKLFRKRGWVGDFFRRTRASVKDTVKIYAISRYQYEVRLNRESREGTC